MALLSGANEVAVGKPQHRRHLPKARRVAVRKLARRKPLPRGRLLHLQTMLVGAGQEEDILPVEPLKASNSVGRDRLVGMPDVRRAVGIRDGGCDVELLSSGHASASKYWHRSGAHSKAGGQFALPRWIKKRAHAFGRC